MQYAIFLYISIVTQARPVRITIFITTIFITILTINVFFHYYVHYVTENGQKIGFYCLSQTFLGQFIIQQYVS